MSGQIDSGIQVVRRKLIIMQYQPVAVPPSTIVIPLPSGQCTKFPILSVIAYDQRRNGKDLMAGVTRRLPKMAES